MQFKMVAEKLKKEPILKDTKLNVIYYRTLTGACDHGCRSWMGQNKLPYKVLNEGTPTEETIYVDDKGKDTFITAKELLPLLEKSNAWGVDKFKSLVTF